MKTLVTGSNGFIGSSLVTKLAENGHTVRCAARKLSNLSDAGSEVAYDHVSVGSIDSSTDWTKALQNIDSVVHLAARVHVMTEFSRDPLSEFCKVNLGGTVRLAEQAVESGVKRFVYVSTIKVNGEKTGERSFTIYDKAKLTDPYGLSKAKSEYQLLKIAANSDMEVVIVRPPLVYGPGVGGNFLRLIKIIECGVPLPLGSIRNLRSMISIDNITDFLALCLKHPKAAGNIFLVSDGVDWSTPMLIRSIASYMGVQVRLFPFPLLLLRLAGRISGQLGAVNRLCDSLEVDISRTCELLDWTPPQLPEEGIRQAVNWYLSCDESVRD